MKKETALPGLPLRLLAHTEHDPLEVEALKQGPVAEPARNEEDLAHTGHRRERGAAQTVRHHRNVPPAENLCALDEAVLGENANRLRRLRLIGR